VSSVNRPPGDNDLLMSCRTVHSGLLSFRALLLFAGVGFLWYAIVFIRAGVMR
jgi:hypothetical protein